MDIPIYDPRDDYDYAPVRRPKPQASEPNQRNPYPYIDRELPKEPEHDERSPIQRHLESLKRQAADRREIAAPHPHPKRECVVRHEVPREERKRTRSQEIRLGRDRLPAIAVDLRLRPEETRLLGDVGRFRVITARDLTETIYRGNCGQMERDLAYLREKNLTDTSFINGRRDGRNRPVERIQVVTLTEEGRNVLLRTGQLHRDQEAYAGLVKPREAEHDAQVYRAYLKEWERIEKKDRGSNPRVVLDFELKANIQRAIHARQKTEPDEDLSAIKQQVAEQFDLKFIDDSIQIPDLRIEYDLDQGALSGHSDVEVATAAYHGRHLAAKLQAGFHLYASASDRATLTARIEDDHDMMRSILDL